MMNKRTKELKELYIIGAGGFGREVSDSVRDISRAAEARARHGAASGDGMGADYGAGAETVAAYRIAGFIDDDETKWGSLVNDIEVVGGIEWLRSRGASVGDSGDSSEGKPHAVIAIADPQTKRKVAEYLDGAVIWETIIHPTAIVSPYAKIGEGGILQPYAAVSSQVSIGKHIILNGYSGIGHDAVLGDFVSVMSKCDITGNTTIGDGVYLATSVAIIPDTTVGDGAFLGAGSVIMKDVERGATMIGNPARRVA
ncbi:MAG: hypothetical protein LBG82_03400 [Clostridiales Family XIII bacterium]|jgi:sugar O-acyltransferase (sialic acid O-acetyltransferase NeuD family)|nr:hypothetical protein [Clostridiales Family XIII bacterium]